MAEFSWQFLERQPYGIAIWDLAMVQGKEAVVFMAREPRDTVEALLRKIDARWKSGIMKEGNVYLGMVLILVNELQTIYEMYFNFYGQEGPAVQKAFELLASQPLLVLNFHDRGAVPVRNYIFGNRIGHFFSGSAKILKAVKPWDDNEFNRAKASIMQRYPIDRLWETLE